MHVYLTKEQMNFMILKFINKYFNCFIINEKSHYCILFIFLFIYLVTFFLFNYKHILIQFNTIKKY